MPTTVQPKAAAKKTAAKKIATKVAKTAAAKKIVAVKKTVSKKTAPVKPQKVLKSAKNANNDALREMVAALGVTQEEALRRFNVGFGIKPMSMAAWKSYFVKPDSTRHRTFGAVLLEHAQRTLGTP